MLFLSFGGTHYLGRFDRYLLGQLLMLFGFFSLVLVLVFWVNSAVGLLDTLLGDGQSASTFMLLSVLTLPSVISRVLAIAGFAATVFVTNRLASESELVVAQASGYSPFRLSRAAFVFSLVVVMMIGVLSHALVPMSLREGDLRRSEIAQDLTARFLTEGTFVHPSDGMTFYVREITPASELLDIYLSSISEVTGDRESFAASRALIVREETGPMLLMFDGTAQSYDRSTRRLAVTRFDSFAYSLGDVIGDASAPPQRLNTTTSFELLTGGAALREQLGVTAAEARAALHERNGEALLAVAAVMIGFATLIAGGFSRFGLTRQILFAVVMLVVVKFIDNAANASGFWPLVYAPAMAGMAISAALLWRAGRPDLGVRRARRREVAS